MSEEEETLDGVVFNLQRHILFDKGRMERFGVGEDLSGAEVIANPDSYRKLENIYYNEKDIYVEK